MSVIEKKAGLSRCQGQGQVCQASFLSLFQLTILVSLPFHPVHRGENNLEMHSFPSLSKAVHPYGNSHRDAGIITSKTNHTFPHIPREAITPSF